MIVKISIDDIIDFARTKSGPYNYMNSSICAMAQYAKEFLGYEDPVIHPYEASGDFYGSIYDGLLSRKLLATYDPLIELPLVRAGTWEDLVRDLEEIMENEEFARYGAQEHWLDRHSERTYAHDECDTYCE